jgi:hypothetical protein
MAALRPRERGRGGRVLLGASYLSVCEAACRGGADEGARAMLEGIKLLLGGGRDSFSLEYPCHSPAGGAGSSRA